MYLIRSRFYPELKHIAGDESRRNALELAERSACKRDVWVPVVSVFLISMVVRWLPQPLGIPIEHRSTINTIFSLLVLATGTTCMVWRYPKHVRRNLREFLNREGPFICVNCGYSLKETQSSRCPECGEAVSSK